jgi:hypothetical protein
MSRFTSNETRKNPAFRSSLPSSLLQLIISNRAPATKSSSDHPYLTLSHATLHPPRSGLKSSPPSPMTQNSTLAAPISASNSSISSWQAQNFPQTPSPPASSTSPAIRLSSPDYEQNYTSLSLQEHLLLSPPRKTSFPNRRHQKNAETRLSRPRPSPTCCSTTWYKHLWSTHSGRHDRQLQLSDGPHESFALP